MFARKLPEEFNFISAKSPYKIVFHAKKIATMYEVTWEISGRKVKTVCSEKEMRRRFNKKNYKLLV